MITADTYDKDIDALLAKVSRLQADLTDVIGAVGTIGAHGLEDIREEAAAGAEALRAQGNQVRTTMARRAAELEASIENTVRTQPVLVAALAAALGVVVIGMAVRH